MSEPQAPYGPAPPRHLRLVKPKKEEGLTPEQKEIFRPLIELLKWKYKLKYYRKLEAEGKNIEPHMKKFEAFLKEWNRTHPESKKKDEDKKYE